MFSEYTFNTKRVFVGFYYHQGLISTFYTIACTMELALHVP